MADEYLRREYLVGVPAITLTPEEQARVEELRAAGDMEGAQRIILDVLRRSLEPKEA